MVAGEPYQGGATWAVLQYVLGLLHLGHDVILVEPIARDSITPPGSDLGSSSNARYFHDVATAFGLCGRSSMVDEATRATVGLSYDALLERARSTDLVINISGMLTDAGLLEAIPRRLYLDLDPAFNQLWHAVQGINVRFDGHSHFATIGVGIGNGTCVVPACGRRWIPTLQPIVLSEWPVTSGDREGPWTTVANWRGYGSIEYGGVQYGQKAHSMRRLLSIPRRVDEAFVLALSIHPDEVGDLAGLSSQGWRLVDPRLVAGTPDDYRKFIQASKAEFAVAKSGYVASRCGWFSDRSICYLASGRPVAAEDTGVDGVLPTGTGLLTFSTEDEAVRAIETISRDYARHAAAAREIAEEYFDASRVLPKLLEAVAS
jgi:hypothetical protein